MQVVFDDPLNYYYYYYYYYQLKKQPISVEISSYLSKSVLTNLSNPRAIPI